MTKPGDNHFIHDGLVQAVLTHGLLVDDQQRCRGVYGDALFHLKTASPLNQPLWEILEDSLCAEYQHLHQQMSRHPASSVSGPLLTLLPLFDSGWTIVRLKVNATGRSGDLPRDAAVPFPHFEAAEVLLNQELQVVHASQTAPALLGLPEPVVGLDFPSSLGNLQFTDLRGVLTEVLFALNPMEYTRQVVLGNQQYLLSIHRFQKVLHSDRLLRVCITRISQKWSPDPGQPITPVPDGQPALTPEQQLHLQSERLGHALLSSSEGLWDWDVLRDQLYLSAGWFRLLGEPQTEQVVGISDWLTRIHPEDRLRVTEQLQSWVHGGNSIQEVEYRIRHQDGSLRWMLTRGQAVQRAEGGEALRLVGVHIDTTELHNTRQELVQLHERISLATRTAGIGVWEWDIEHNHMVWDQHMLDIYGLGPEEFGKSPLTAWDERLHPEDAQRVLQEVDWALHDVRPFETEYRILRPDGTERVIKSSASLIRDDSGKPLRFLGVDWDITSHKQAAALIEYQAKHDPLTGLPNRRLFMELMDYRLKDQKRNGKMCAVLFINLDRFKDVNDTLGHEAGDLLLTEVSTRLKLCTRESDLIARVGGDEFTILLSGLDDPSVAEHVADRILHVLAHPYLIKGQNLQASASIGICMYPTDALDGETLLNNADQAMYVAKEEGKNCWRTFTPSMQQATQERRTVINDFTQALRRGEFEVHYQPILSYAGDPQPKAEALLRWKHPDKGFVSPGVFIPLAEEVGLIHQLAEWCLRRVIQDQQRWQAEGLPCPVISINTSAKQFMQDDVAARWLHHIRDLGAKPEQLIMEITESLLLQKEGQVLSQLETLRKAGIKLALDDFGTGYSSLSYLSSFELDYLKIDRSFVRGICHNSKDEAVTDAIIAMAHKLGLQVVAEGVETLDQETVLHRQHCDYAQGFYYARPMPEAQLRGFLQQFEVQSIKTP